MAICKKDETFGDSVSAVTPQQADDSAVSTSWSSLSFASTGKKGRSAAGSGWVTIKLNRVVSRVGGEMVVTRKISDVNCLML